MRRLEQPPLAIGPVSHPPRCKDDDTDAEGGEANGEGRGGAAKGPDRAIEQSNRPAYDHQQANTAKHAPQHRADQKPKPKRPGRRNTLETHFQRLYAARRT